MPVHNIITLAKNDQLTGHLLMRPFLWYWKQVDVILAPFPTSASGREQLIDIAKRACLVVSFFFSTFAVASAVVGLGIKKIAHLLSPQSRVIGGKPPIQLTSHLAEDVPAVPPTSGGCVINNSDQILPIFQDLKELNRLMDVMLLDLTTIQGDPGKQFQEAIKQFEEKYKDVDSPTSFTDLQELKSLFQQLEQLKPGLFFVKQGPIYTELKKGAFSMEQSGIVSIPNDGNCLFHALGKGMEILQILEISNHDQLRSQVVQWMVDAIKTDSHLQVHIDEAIRGFINARRREYDEERITLDLLSGEGQDVAEQLKLLAIAQQELNDLETFVERQDSKRHAWYFEKMDKPGFFASNAEIYAISHIYQIAITVRRKIRGEIIRGFDPVMSPHGHCTRSLTLLHVDNNHFELQLYESSKSAS